MSDRPGFTVPFTKRRRKHQPSRARRDWKDADEKRNAMGGLDKRKFERIFLGAEDDERNTTRN